MKRLMHAGLLTLFVGSFFLPQQASALPTLSLSDGTTTVTLGDEGVLDKSDGELGVVTFIGKLGVWNVNVTTGITFPVLGAADRPHMDLNSVNVSGGGGGTLTIMFSEVGYSNPFSVFHTEIGGTVDDTAGSSVQYRTYLDAGNTLFGTVTPITNHGSAGSGAFSSTRAGSGGGAGPFSLTQVVQITHVAGAGQSSSFDAELNTVPEPTSMLLLGSGLLGLGLWGRKRMQA